VVVRARDADGTVADAVESAFRTFSGTTPWLAIAFAAALVAAPIVARNDRTAGALAVVFRAVARSRSRRSSDRAREAILLPPAPRAVSAADGPARAALVARTRDRCSRAEPDGAAACRRPRSGWPVTARDARAYVADPLPYFRDTKTLRDVRGLKCASSRRAPADAPPDWRWILLLEKRRQDTSRTRPSRSISSDGT
jgi:hypothetical protein